MMQAGRKPFPAAYNIFFWDVYSLICMTWTYVVQTYVQINRQLASQISTDFFYFTLQI